VRKTELNTDILNRRRRLRHTSLCYLPHACVCACVIRYGGFFPLQRDGRLDDPALGLKKKLSPSVEMQADPLPYMSEPDWKDGEDSGTTAPRYRVPSFNHFTRFTPFHSLSLCH